MTRRIKLLSLEVRPGIGWESGRWGFKTVLQQFSQLLTENAAGMTAR